MGASSAPNFTVEVVMCKLLAPVSGWLQRLVRRRAWMLTALEVTGDGASDSADDHADRQVLKRKQHD